MQLFPKCDSWLHNDFISSCLSVQSHSARTAGTSRCGFGGLAQVGGLALVRLGRWVLVGWPWWALSDWFRLVLAGRWLLPEELALAHGYAEPVGEVHAHGERGLCDSCSPYGHQPRMSQPRSAGKAACPLPTVWQDTARSRADEGNE